MESYRGWFWICGLVLWLRGRAYDGGVLESFLNDKNSETLTHAIPKIRLKPT